MLGKINKLISYQKRVEKVISYLAYRQARKIEKAIGRPFYVVAHTHYDKPYFSVYKEALKATINKDYGDNIVSFQCEFYTKELEQKVREIIEGVER